MFPDFHGGHGGDEDHEHEEGELAEPLEPEVFPVVLDEDAKPNLNPGSDYSIANGCICDPTANNDGVAPSGSSTNGYARDWVITEGCPVHV
jgi:hypothetical protein